jgi:hypothetical protein
MPNRIIRESCRTSPTLDQLSDAAERLWWRLLTVADDYGRFDARPEVVCALSYPLRAGRQGEVARVRKALDELEQVGGIRRYAVAGRLYGYFVNWETYQRKPLSKAKFPSPDLAESPPDRSCQALTDPVRPCQTLTDPDSRIVIRDTRNRDTRNTGCTEERGSGGESAPTRVETSRSAPTAPEPVRQRLCLSDQSEQTAFEGPWFAVTDALVRHWREVYPACDVLAEIRRASEWISANPERRKRNWRRYLTGWLARSQDRGGSVRPRAQSRASPQPLRERAEEIERNLVAMGFAGGRHEPEGAVGNPEPVRNGVRPAAAQSGGPARLDGAARAPG